MDIQKQVNTVVNADLNSNLLSVNKEGQFKQVGTLGWLWRIITGKSFDDCKSVKVAEAIKKLGTNNKLTQAQVKGLTKKLMELGLKVKNADNKKEINKIVEHMNNEAKRTENEQEQDFSTLTQTVKTNTQTVVGAKKGFGKKLENVVKLVEKEKISGEQLFRKFGHLVSDQLDAGVSNKHAALLKDFKFAIGAGDQFKDQEAYYHNKIASFKEKGLSNEELKKGFQEAIKEQGLKNINPDVYFPKE